MKRYAVTTCPGCGRRLSVNGIDIHRTAASPGAGATLPPLRGTPPVPLPDPVRGAKDAHPSRSVPAPSREGSHFRG